jgi:hypothetical protein
MVSFRSLSHREDFFSVGGKDSRRVKLTTHLHVILTSNIRGFITFSPPFVFMTLCLIENKYFTLPSPSRSREKLFPRKIFGNKRVPLFFSRSCYISLQSRHPVFKSNNIW